MTNRPENAPDPQVREYKPPRSYSAGYKQKILAEYEQLDRTEKGALLRREGLYTQLISHWRHQRDAGATEALDRGVGRPKADPRGRQIAKLQAENAKLAGDLGRAQQVIEVQSKLSALLDQLATGSDDAPNGGEPR
ncbi:MAG: hypothetical protein ACRDMV_02135 [Streptosporangiales bacterium]